MTKQNTNKNYERIFYHHDDHIDLGDIVSSDCNLSNSCVLTGVLTGVLTPVLTSYK